MKGFLWFLVMMNIIALCKGFYKNGGFDVLLEFKLLSNPYYNIGVLLYLNKHQRTFLLG
jgi:hypothetical protein